MSESKVTEETKTLHDLPDDSDGPACDIPDGDLPEVIIISDPPVSVDPNPPTPPPTPSPPPVTDPEAPYGRFKNGKPMSQKQAAYRARQIAQAAEKKKQKNAKKSWGHLETVESPPPIPEPKPTKPDKITRTKRMVKALNKKVDGLTDLTTKVDKLFEMFSATNEMSDTEPSEGESESDNEGVEESKSDHSDAPEDAEASEDPAEEMARPSRPARPVRPARRVPASRRRQKPAPRQRPVPKRRKRQKAIVDSDSDSEGGDGGESLFNRYSWLN
eukprot:TRINITY_DN31316_c0_g1_i13.p1 TRINITY_DN31316_c0_g1~~TRINITY_DN31316_c0_g1_i13.p1  ORF type:complete len:273 (-),score=68.32 TRINITY_DN31316_c0_g1_i13:84-902(-)